MMKVRPWLCPGGCCGSCPLVGVRAWGDTHSLGVWAPISPSGKWASVQAACAVAQEKSGRLAATSVEPQAVCKVLISHCPNLVEGEAELISGPEAGPHVLCALCSAAAVASPFQLRRPKLFLWRPWRGCLGTLLEAERSEPLQWLPRPLASGCDHFPYPGLPLFGVGVGCWARVWQ